MQRGQLVLAALFVSAFCGMAQKLPGLSAEEQAIDAQLAQLRKLPDEEWREAVGRLAKQVQQLPSGTGKTYLLTGLVSQVTEGDAGPATLQTVADTLAQVLRGSPNPRLAEMLARLARYEHVQVSPVNQDYQAALARLEAEDRQRQSIDFSLWDTHGKQWTLSKLRGEVVLVNFWATWCPPCRKEMPDMEALYRRFRRRGLVILAISDEGVAKVRPFLEQYRYSFPVLLDPAREVHERFHVEGIPKSFVYDRRGRLVSQAIDRRTERQFLAMLKQAGME